MGFANSLLLFSLPSTMKQYFWIEKRNEKQAKLIQYFLEGNAI
jgi:hypothetical protein